VTGLPTEYVTALLAHELAHVCRRDYLVNLLQRVAEALLFYHPAVWWVSGQIRVEREMCCDDIAVAAQGDPVLYARALAELDASRAAWRSLELAADGPSLIDRVRRLLGHTLSPWQLLPGPGGLAAIAVLWLVGIVAVTARTERAAPPTAAIAPMAQVDTTGTGSGLIATALLGPLGPSQSQTTAPGAPAGRAGVVESSEPPRRSDDDRTSVIRGRVTSATTGLPLRNAKVRLWSDSPSADRGNVAITDEDGRYELSGVTPGKYDISANKPGFVDMRYGSRSPLTRGKPLEAASGQALDRIDMALPAGGVVTGVVLDAAGDPLAGVVVQARSPYFINGVVRPTFCEVASDVTDDLGRYRLFGLQVDSYFLAASLRNPARADADLMRRPVIFYPGTPRWAEATPVRVEAGREVTAQPLTLAPVRTAKVSGVVTRHDGKPPGDVSVTLQLAGANLPVHGPRDEVFNSAFTFKGVALGDYTLLAQSGEGEAALATATFTVDGADVEVSLVLRRMSTLRGRVTFEGDATNASLTGPPIAVGLRDDDDNELGGPIDTDGTFEISGVYGRRRLEVELPQGWGLKWMRVGNQDLMESFLEFDGEDINDVDVRLTPRLTVISGRVSGLPPNPGQGVVLIFPADPDHWRYVRSFRVGLAPIDESGGYRVDGLVPGRYLAIALESFAYADYGALERLAPHATAVTIAEGEQRALDLRLVSR
jgi:protocatechuate 3,4-dioxygenase beta subunit